MSDDPNRILVVDDDDLLREVLGLQLMRFGYGDIVFAADGVSALDALRKNEFDLVLLDVQMPGMSGADLLGDIRSDLQLHDIPIILISGKQDEELVNWCIEKGAEDFLRKPVEPNLLRARLSSVFERQRLRRIEAAVVGEIKLEKRRADALLEFVLPPSAARELRTTGSVRARRYADVGILFCDIVNFTEYCATHTPDEVVGRLEALFVRFEEITRHHGLEKIMTIGDAFLAAASLNDPLADPLHSAVACDLDMIAATEEVCPGWRTRVGVAEGAVIGGVVGRERSHYDIWGDTVGLATHLGELGRTGTVTMSYDSWRSSGRQYAGKLLGEVDVADFGPLRIVECTGLVGAPRAAAKPASILRLVSGS